MEIQYSEVRAKCVSDEKKTNFHIQSERDIIYAHVLLSIYTPFPCTHTLWKVSDLVYDVFSFLYPKNLDSIKYSKLTAFHILLYPPEKKLVATALELIIKRSSHHPTNI